MKKFVTLIAGAAIATTMATVALADDLVVGVSWSNFQEERWKTDEAAIKEACLMPLAPSTSRPTRSLLLPSS